MADAFLALSPQDQREALAQASAHTGRPAHLLEKDVWVVWVLQVLFEPHLSAHLTFKGGTTLSKVYQVIDRFSEDIDLTYDIRKLIPDLLGTGPELPASRSQANAWTRAIRHRLPDWITTNVQPVLQAALDRQRLDACLTLGGQGQDALLVAYPAASQGTGYVAPVVTLEFGGRATGEPHQAHHVTCDMAEVLSEVNFPSATPLVMDIARTFWEKATAAHVYCTQGRLRSERFARHWHDLAAMAHSPHFDAILAKPHIAQMVGHHKSVFFMEKDSEGHTIDYIRAVSGALQIVPEGEARHALAQDYAAMVDDAVMVGDTLSWEALLAACAELETRINVARRSHGT